MKQIICPGARSGYVKVPASKSMAHRYMICAALSEQGSIIKCDGISKDISATANCLRGMGASVNIERDQVEISGENLLKYRSFAHDESFVLPCGESGSTLRFLLPVAGALGMEAVFEMEGRLPERPMAEFEAVLCGNGMNIRREGSRLFCSGKLRPGEYKLPGNISSQYFSGLFFALPLLGGDSRIIIEGKLESADYLEMTKDSLRKSGIIWQERENAINISGNQKYDIDLNLTVEGDYSSAAFLLCAGAFSEKGITVKGLSGSSMQGDRRIIDILVKFGATVEVSDYKEIDDGVFIRKGNLHGMDIDASMIPDLVPVISVVAALSEGTTRIYNAARLRMKESDRLKSTADMLNLMGADVMQTQDGLIINGKDRLSGGVTIDPVNDHRIAMSAAVAAITCKEPVTVNDAQCVEKSYPNFWKDFQSLENDGFESIVNR